MGLFKSRGKHAHGAKKKGNEQSPALDPSAEKELALAALDDASFEASSNDVEREEVLESALEPTKTAEEIPAADAADTADAAEVIEAVPAGEVDGKPGFVSGEFGEIPQKKSRRGLKIFGITMGVIMGLVAVAYIAGAIVFMGRFLPGTFVGDHDVSLMPDAEVAEVLDVIVDDYKLSIAGGGFSYRTTGKDINLDIDTDDVVKAMHADLNAWKWPMLILQEKHDETGQLVVDYDQKAFEPNLTEAITKYNETAQDPVNATIVYEQRADKFVVKPEEPGTKYNPSAVLKKADAAIEALDPKIGLSDEQLIQPTVFSTDEKLIEAAQLATGMVSAKLTLMMGGKQAGEVDGNALSQFIFVNDQFEVTFKEDEMNAWVQGLAEGFNTVGAERTYTRADGKVVSVSGGVYGWEIDTEALKNAVLEGIKAGETAQIEVPCLETAAVFTGANQRDWGNRYIDVDISEQHVRFYGDSGAIIWEADCISGAPDGQHDTGRGVWTVNAKESPSKLIGYERGKKIYETTVKYWMPFEGNGIGFHDATWQPSFGGAMYANGYGSHGCVNLSYNDAQSLYGIIEWGDVVVVHD